MSRRRVHIAITLAFAASCGVALENGCSATGAKPIGITTTGTGGAPHSDGGEGGNITLYFDAGDADTPEGMTNPCHSQCGPTELCDPAHLGIDDNCNGLVDEGCSCNLGSVHGCFKGDFSYHDDPGCFEGTESCSELGLWGPCVGGVHAIPPDNCYLNDTSACHAIRAQPYASVDLKSGTGTFGANAVPGSETYTVQCPTGVSQCPTVMPPSSFEALQSGQYTVTYTKRVTGDPNPKTCTFPLFVGAPGLRVELSWEHTTADNGVDLDLHLHQPVNTQPWAIFPGEPQDCGWASCKEAIIATGVPPAPHWFPDSDMAPLPVNWDDDTTNMANNTCYNDPRGVGAMWQALGKGCYNPRLDVDDRTCDFAITDPTNPSFCTPENINVDYPPDKQWFRIGVHYFWNQGEVYDVHPEVKVFCNGALSADLGPQGFYDPSSPITFTSADGQGSGQGNVFWIAADVAFATDTCSATTCVVQPIYSDLTSKTPLIMLDTEVSNTFMPAWPSPPP